MKLLKILAVIFMSVVICCAAGVFGLFINMINPNGLSLIPKKTVVLAPEKVKQGVPVKSIIEPAKKTEVKKYTVPAVGSKPITMKVPVVEKLPVTKEAVKIEEQNINLEQAKLLFDSKKAVFVDARPEYTYLERHIKGAILLSASRFELQFEQKKDKLNENDLYVVYCSSPTCHLSNIVAGYLKEKGFNKVKIFTAGWDAWLAADFPIEGLKVKTSGGKNE